MKDLTSSEAFLVSNKKQWDFYLQIKLFHVQKGQLFIISVSNKQQSAMVCYKAIFSKSLVNSSNTLVCKLD
jgi:hypothetical protein